MESIALHRAEAAGAGTDHAEVANWLFAKWKFPRDTRRAVKNHHSADCSLITPVSEDALTGVTYFANQAARRLGFGTGRSDVCEWDEAGFKKFFESDFGGMGLNDVQLGKEVQLHLEILGLKPGSGSL